MVGLFFCSEVISQFHSFLLESEHENISEIPNFLADTRGDLVQDSLIWVLVAIVAISALTGLGGKIVTTLTTIAASL